MLQVSVYDAKSRLSRLIDEALSGEEIVIMRNSVPVVRLVKIEERPKSRDFGHLKGKISPDFDRTSEEFDDYV